MRCGKPSLFTVISRGNEGKVYPRFWCVLAAYLIAAVFPPRFWYGLALRSTFITAWVVKFKSNQPARMLRAIHLNRLLSLLTRTGLDFPIPYRDAGLSNLESAAKCIFLTVHLPLSKVAIRSLLDNGVVLNAAIAGVPTKDGKMSVYGLSEKIDILVKNNWVLLKAKNVLQNNGNIVLMVDNEAGDYYSPNIMHLAQKTGARVVFFFSVLDSKQQIINSFIAPPYPYCGTDAEIDENIRFLKVCVADKKSGYTQRTNI